MDIIFILILNSQFIITVFKIHNSVLKKLPRWVGNFPNILNLDSFHYVKARKHLKLQKLFSFRITSIF